VLSSRSTNGPRKRVYDWQDKALFFQGMVAGRSMSGALAPIGASLDCGHRWWRDSAGMKLKMGPGHCGPVDAPAVDARVGRGLTALERDVIQAGHHTGLCPAAIARQIGRHRSTVTRELQRNQGPDGTYYASIAHVRAATRRRRPKQFKLNRNRSLCRLIERHMDEGWSPGLIAQVLAIDYGSDHAWRVSHETIYQCLYVQTRGLLRADLHQQLSLKRRARVSRTGTRRGPSPFKEAYKISERPAEVNDRAVPGHWEGDLIVGKNSGSAIGTLVERTTRFTILLHLPGRHTADEVAAAMIPQMRSLPEHLRRSITWDRGVELAAYRDIQLALDTRLYFCDPHSPWQRGTNENTNRLLRHWFAKGTDLSVHTAADLKRVQDSLNRRPRPTLELRTPAQALAKYLAQAA
jgi:transposase, IS30 family